VSGYTSPIIFYYLDKPPHEYKAFQNWIGTGEYFLGKQDATLLFADIIPIVFSSNHR